MNIALRKFEEKDIPYKMQWVNDPSNNRFLHYDLPLELEKTKKWYHLNIGRTDRNNTVIKVDGVSVGLAGLLSIDDKNRKAEFYILIGNRDYLGKGIAKQASFLILQHAFKSLHLNRIYLFTECDNVPAQKLFKKIGFQKEGLLKNDLFYNGRYVDRYCYGIKKSDFEGVKSTIITKLGSFVCNELYVKREDLLPFSFGGNKARKAKLFFEDIKNKGCGCVITYGSSGSNHCRVVANLAKSTGVKCYIISPQENYKKTFNSKLLDKFGRKILCPVDRVGVTIEKTMKKLSESGAKPYFI